MPGARASVAAPPCTTTVHGVEPGRASIVPHFLPGGFHLTSGDPTDITATDVTYSAAVPKLDPPRVTIGYSVLTGPLTWTVGGRPIARRLVIQRHPAILEDGPPGPQWVSVYWKPDRTHLLSVVGYKTSGAVVIQVAGGLSLTPQGPIQLPVTPRPIVNRTRALTAAHAVIAAGWTVAAKLSSWTEVQALLQADFSGWKQPAPPKILTATPWTPIWTVLATKQDSHPRIVIVLAQTGEVAMAAPTRQDHSWFAALTDRDPTLGKGCPGGTTTRLPFGVLTRTEDTYTIRFEYSLTRTRVIQKLTSVPILNRVDPGLYGGCLSPGCALDELVWPDITVTHAPKGKLMPCPLNKQSNPGVHWPPTRVYYSISVPDNFQGGCRPLPGWVWRLKDLAPPTVHQP